MQRILSLLLFSSALFTQPILAWDAVGHRLSASVALSLLSESKQEQLLDILQQHPRYAIDFLQAMPDSVLAASHSEQRNWLIGQAAFWPDVARGLPRREREKYNHPPWHYEDGRWIRDAATIQGNIYLEMEALEAIQGEAAASVRNEQDVNHLMTALDYNTQLLANRNTPAEQRALALCWVLHLMGDIHQPLHTGALFSVDFFPTGDRGGNGIRIGDSSLHLVWDRALRDEGIANNLPRILSLLSENPRHSNLERASNWSLWMQESREILLNKVYTEVMKQAVLDADQQQSLAKIELSPEYIVAMKEIARQRLGLAGLRLSIWFENELD